MATSKHQDKNVKSSVREVITLAQTIVQFAPIAERLFKNVIDDRKSRVKVPDLCDSQYQHDLIKAEDALTACRLKMMIFKLPIKEASPKYKDYFDMQVVSTEPKAGHWVEFGETVKVLYITQDVIDESQRLFEEDEKRKAEAKQGKIVKREQRREQAHKIFDVPDKAKACFGRERKNR